MPSPQKKSNRKRKHIQKPWNWGDDQEKAFNKLKELLSSTPIIGYPDYKLPFELHADASGIGLGAVASDTMCPTFGIKNEHFP
jgi:hypothetical protein